MEQIIKNMIGFGSDGANAMMRSKHTLFTSLINYIPD